MERHSAPAAAIPNSQGKCIWVRRANLSIFRNRQLSLCFVDGNVWTRRVKFRRLWPESDPMGMGGGPASSNYLDLTTARGPAWPLSCSGSPSSGSARRAFPKLTCTSIMLMGSSRTTGGWRHPERSISACAMGSRARWQTGGWRKGPSGFSSMGEGESRLFGRNPSAVPRDGRH